MKKFFFVSCFVIFLLITPNILVVQQIQKSKLGDSIVFKSSVEKMPGFDNWLNKVQKQIEDEEYQPTLQEKDAKGYALPKNTYHFINRVHNLRSYINHDGWKLESREINDEEDSWFWQYQLQSLKRGEKTISTFTAPIAITEKNHIVSLDRGLLTEWYKNSKAGIEQGVTINEKPKGEGKLILSAIIKSDLSVNSWSSDKVTFSNSKKDIFSLSNLCVVDAHNQSIPA